MVPGSKHSNEKLKYASDYRVLGSHFLAHNSIKATNKKVDRLRKGTLPPWRKQSGLALSATLENKAYKAKSSLEKQGFVPDRDAAPLVVIIPLTTSYDQLPGSNVNLRIFKHEAKQL